MASFEDTQLVTTGDFIDDPWRGATVPLTDSGDELLGTTLNGTYVVERVLGEGGMGRVYLARHTRIAQKRVAVKVLHVQFAQDPQVLARFQREAEAAAAISHPNVVAVLDVDRTPRGLPYLVCEYLDGVEFGDYLKNVGKLDVVSAVHIARQLCRGLAAAHASGVIHRDLKPANVFLVGDFSAGVPARPTAKLLDFGLSRFVDSAQNQQLTTKGLIMGTPSYMAPEQARARPIDKRVDVYGVGALLYVSLTGRPPFDEETPQATVLAVMTSAPPRPRAIEPSIAPEIEVVIQQAMSRDPEQRYADTAALDRALEDALSALDLDVSMTQRAAQRAIAPARAPLPSSRHRLAVEQASGARFRLALWIATGVLVVLAGAVIAISGVEVLSGGRLDRLELQLLVLGIAGSLFTPAALWIGHLRRRIWQDSARVLTVLALTRAAVLAYLLTLGGAVLLLHVVDDFLIRVLAEPRLPGLGATWQGWNALLPAMALISAAATAWCRRKLVLGKPGLGRTFAVSFVASLAVALSLSLLYVGVRLQDARALPTSGQTPKG